MQPEFLFFAASIAFSLVVWGALAKVYVWPRLRHRSRAEALRPLLYLHSFRFEGLAFLIPGVVAPDLPASFARSAAYGDLIAALLAMLTLRLLARSSMLPVAWLFNLWGSLDLLNAFYQANRAGLQPGQLGAAFFIPTLLVPLLLITHGMAFRIMMASSMDRTEQPRAGASVPGLRTGELPAR